MRTCLFTCDPHVITTVKQVTSDVIVQSDQAVDPKEADIYIWDLDLATEIPSQILKHREEQQLLLLVNPAKVPFIDAELLTRSCLLMKPVNTFTVRAFLDLTTRTCQLSAKANQTDQLRSDRDALVQYVLATNLRLQEYDHKRTNFLARALHDLRAPLTALHGYCGLLADGQLGPISPMQQELFNRMRSSARRLSRQAAGMFELTVLGQVGKEPKWTAGDIEDPVMQALHEVHPLFQDKDQNITVNLSPAEDDFFFDAEQITQALINILENCSKFTSVAGSINVRGYNVKCDFSSNLVEDAASTANAYRLDVRDNGPGIQQGLFPTIFEQYTSYSGGQDRSGGGLGLAICKMIVTAHQGFIWAEDSEKGALFSLVLPFRPLPQSPSNWPALQPDVV